MAEVGKNGVPMLMRVSLTVTEASLGKPDGRLTGPGPCGGEVPTGEDREVRADVKFG